MTTPRLLVNFFAGPGAGKTTAASSLFSALKRLSLDVEVVSEFAKDLVLENNRTALNHQWYVIAHQAYRIWCGYQSMQVVICDSPIMLGPVYDPDNSRALYALCLEHHHRYTNLNIYLQRQADMQYSMSGRVHSLTQSVALDNQILGMLTDNNIPHVLCSKYTRQFEQTIIDQILQHLAK